VRRDERKSSHASSSSVTQGASAQRLAANAANYVLSLKEPELHNRGVRVPDMSMVLSATTTMTQFFALPTTAFSVGSGHGGGMIMTPDAFETFNQVDAGTGSPQPNWVVLPPSTRTSSALYTPMTTNAALYRTVSMGAKIRNFAPLLSRGGKVYVNNTLITSQAFTPGFTRDVLLAHPGTRVFDAASLEQGLDLTWVPFTLQATLESWAVSNTPSLRQRNGETQSQNLLTTACSSGLKPVMQRASQTSASSSL